MNKRLLGLSLAFALLMAGCSDKPTTNEFDGTIDVVTNDKANNESKTTEGETTEQIITNVITENLEAYDKKDVESLKLTYSKDHLKFLKDEIKESEPDLNQAEMEEALKSVELYYWGMVGYWFEGTELDYSIQEIEVLEITDLSAKARVVYSVKGKQELMSGEVKDVSKEYTKLYALTLEEDGWKIFKEDAEKEVSVEEFVDVDSKSAESAKVQVIAKDKASQQIVDVIKKSIAYLDDEDYEGYSSTLAKQETNSDYDFELLEAVQEAGNASFYKEQFALNDLDYVVEKVDVIAKTQSSAKARAVYTVNGEENLNHVSKRQTAVFELVLNEDGWKIQDEKTEKSETEIKYNKK